MYHRVSAVRRDPWQLAGTPAHFAEHLEVIRRHGRPLLVRDLTRSLGTGRAPGRAIILTLDDGYADNLLEARPLLERHDVPATVFVAAGCLGRPSFWWDDLERVILTSTDLPPHLRIVVRGEAGNGIWETTFAIHSTPSRGMRAGRQGRSLRPGVIACSSRCTGSCDRSPTLSGGRPWSLWTPGPGRRHRPARRPALSPSRRSRDSLPTVSSRSAPTRSRIRSCPRSTGRRRRTEIHGSRLALEEITGGTVVSFAYPYGARSDYTPETLSLVKEAGFSGACVTMARPVGRGTPPFELPRFHVEDCDGDGLARRLAAWAVA